MAFHRCLTVLASFTVALELFFLGFADYHIASNSDSRPGRGPGLGPGASLGGRDGASGGRRPEERGRQQQQYRGGQTDATTSNYAPDYTKFNTSHPPILYASSPGSLSSLPDANRVPRHVLAAQNLTEHFSRWDHAKDPHALFVYNPSIVPLSLAQLSDSAQYLGTFRVSSIHSCGFPTYEFWKYPVDYVGLAILDKDLKVATVGEDSLDIIVDINAHLPKIFNRRLKFQDVRLFTLHDRVFMSSGVNLVPICVKVDGIGADMGSLSSPAICADVNNDAVEELPALYRNNNRLRLFVAGDAIRMKDTDGKNFQFFHISTPVTSKNEPHLPTIKTLMEYWPQGPRLVHDLGDEIPKIYLEDRKSRQKRAIDLKRRKEFKSEVAPAPMSNVAMSLDSSLKTFIKRDRSSACCVRIAKKCYADMIPALPSSVASELEKLDAIFVGISHSKSRDRMVSSQGDRYNYLSRLYAFSSVEPYGLVARSGLFCFGFPEEHDAKVHHEGVGIEYNELTKAKRLELNGASYNCPNIHFVVSMIEKEGDGSKLIVSYGVNDCVPRFVEISKRDAAVHILSAGNAVVSLPRSNS